MNESAAFWLTLGLIVGGSGLLFWWESRSKRQAHAHAEEAAHQKKEDVMNPDFRGLEEAFGGKLSSNFRELYQDYDLVFREDLEFGISHPIWSSEECDLAWVEPAQLEILEARLPECQGLFPFGNDGSGNQYLVDPIRDDAEVIYACHESGERKNLGVTLGEFVAALRARSRDGRS
jgi:hypothetical protein